MPGFSQVRKLFSDGSQSTSKSKCHHHCPKCGRHGDAKCFTKFHMGYCEVPSCGQRYSTQHGCDRHPYRDGYNLDVKARTEVPPSTLGAELDKLYFNTKSGNFNDKPTSEKIYEVRKAFGHDMTLPENPKGRKGEERKSPWSKEGNNKLRITMKSKKH